MQGSSLCLEHASERSTFAGDTSLEEPLLAPSQSDVDSDALPTSSSGHENSERAIVPRSINKYDWEQLWRALIQGCVQSCANAWSKLNIFEQSNPFQSWFPADPVQVLMLARRHGGHMLEQCVTPACSALSH